MADDELRRLERAASTGGAPERIEWARALLRAGRDGEAMGALGATPDDPLVRTELARFPQWTHLDGPDGRRHLDVAPVRSAPRVRWHLPDPEACAYARQDGLLGGPLGLITSRGFLAITVLDPATGRVHATTPVGTGNGPERSGVPPLSLHGELLFVHGDEQAWVRSIHAWKDQDLWSLPLRLARDEVRAWDATGEKPGPATPVVLPPRHRHDVPYGYTVQGHGTLLGLGALHAGQTRPSMWIGDRLRLRATPDVVYASVAAEHVNVSRHVVLDRATGAPRWSGEGVVEAFDQDGALVEHLGELALRDARDGAVRWRRKVDAYPLVLGPRAIVVAAGEQHRALRVLERATGEPVADLGERDRDGAVAGARDVVYVAGHGALTARGLDGATLWTLDLAEEARARTLPDPTRAARVHALLPAPGRLYAKAWDGTIWCLEA